MRGGSFTTRFLSHPDFYATLRSRDETKKPAVPQIRVHTLCTCVDRLITPFNDPSARKSSNAIRNPNIHIRPRSLHPPTQRNVRSKAWMSRRHAFVGKPTPRIHAKNVHIQKIHPHTANVQYSFESVFQSFATYALVLDRAQVAQHARHVRVGWTTVAACAEADVLRTNVGHDGQAHVPFSCESVWGETL